MSCCTRNCTCASIIAAILLAVALGVLAAFGFVSTGIVFWAYLLIGVLGILLSPLYATLGREGCFCGLRSLILTGAIGTVVTSAAGLIAVPLVGTAVGAVIVGVATFFPVLLLASLVCLVNCLCRD